MQGQDFSWVQQMGGPEHDQGSDLVLDIDGNLYTTGYFGGTADFDPGPGVFNLTSAGDADIFVSKTDAEGNFVWARQLGGTARDLSYDIAVDSSGNTYTTGFFQGKADFDPGPGSVTLTAAGSWNVFICKLDSSGDLVWARQLGGLRREFAPGIAVDASGNVYTTGFFQGTVDFDPGPTAATLTSAGDDDIFLSKIDSDGNFVWARRMGGIDADGGSSIAVDASGDVLVTGYFRGTVDSDPGGSGFNLASAGEQAVFVSKFESTGAFVWAKQMGGLGYPRSTSLAVDGTGNVYTTGAFEATVDFDPGDDTFELTPAGSLGSIDIFVSKLDGAGNFVWAKQMGGPYQDEGSGIAVDGSGNVYTTGKFQVIADFDPGPGVFDLTSASDDAFLSKLDSAGNFVWAQRIGGTNFDWGWGVAVEGNGDVYTTGYFYGTADFDPGPGVFNLTAVGAGDIFIEKHKNGSSTGQIPAIYDGGIVLGNLVPKVHSVSPLSIISVFGQNFSDETILYPNLDGEGKIATILGGTCLLMNGETLPIFAVTPGQINAQTSAMKSLGPASFRVVSNCGTEAAITSAPLRIGQVPRALTSEAEPVMVEEATPAFFLFPPLAEVGFIAARFNSDNAAVAPEGMLTDDYGPSRPAKSGDIIVLYGTGWGATEAGLGTGELVVDAAELLPGANPMVSFGGIPLALEDLLYVGVTPQAAGLYQLAIRVPAGAQTGNNQVVLTVYGKSTPVGPVVPVLRP